VFHKNGMRRSVKKILAKRISPEQAKELIEFEIKREKK